jgi:hypothetical protein
MHSYAEPVLQSNNVGKPMNVRALMLFVLLSCGTTLGQTTRPTTQPSTRQTPDQVMDQLLNPAATQPKPLMDPPTGVAIDKSSGRGAVAPGAPPVSVKREGDYVIDRLGRLGRTSDGTQAQFIFDSDSKTLADPPMIILPNLKLVQMEEVVKATNRDMPFRITGMVTEYRGRNYILIEKVLAMREDVQPF